MNANQRLRGPFSITLFTLWRQSYPTLLNHFGDMLATSREPWDGMGRNRARYSKGVNNDYGAPIGSTKELSNRIDEW
ncbi:hypothetical protein B1748_00725 [Paenibacillus sp. MY03]|uniref:hypothetical protein n=1 Tax=Paenibacillus sp. MY03 TaxID=302980 RepID=UPI000B3C1F5D|nr:hypothetical protein [Paenibacillus sp. MY03]OUS78633.1 hypothetical protein B1748_00725 [Paenibacillus sp. MY03]